MSHSAHFSWLPITTTDVGLLNNVAIVAIDNTESQDAGTEAAGFLPDISHPPVTLHLDNVNHEHSFSFDTEFTIDSKDRSLKI